MLISTSGKAIQEAEKMEGNQTNGSVAVVRGARSWAGVHLNFAGLGWSGQLGHKQFGSSPKCNGPHTKMAKNENNDAADSQAATVRMQLWREGAVQPKVKLQLKGCCMWLHSYRLETWILWTLVLVCCA